MACRKPKRSARPKSVKRKATQKAKPTGRLAINKNSGLLELTDLRTGECVNRWRRTGDADADKRVRADAELFTKYSGLTL